MNKNVLIYGIAYGVFSMIMSYLMFNNLIGMWSSIGLSFLSFIVISIFYVRGMRNKTGASPFKDVFLNLFLISLISIVLSFVLTQVYMASLSEDAKILMQENFVQSQIDSYSSFGFPEEIMIDMEEGLSEEADEMFSLQSQLFGLPISIGFMAFVCLIIGLIMKREPEEIADNLISE